MKTKLLDGGSRKDIKTAADILKRGGLCAMPTETVYGLAASAFDPSAVEKIFEAKGRPQDNPLIVHISDTRELYKLWEEVPESALKLAEAFWPGPMTMIYRRKKTVPDAVTAGLDTVGVRLPAHETARRLIAEAGVPLAAPSANLSGRPSPTSVKHVLADMDGRIDCILDGGDCSVGVESTVVDMTSGTPRILRPGAISEEMIAGVLGSAETDPAVTEGLKKGERPRSPGMKYRHYAPKAPVRLFCGAPDDSVKVLLGQSGDAAALVFDEYLDEAKKRFEKVLPFGESWDHDAHKRILFAALRELDTEKAIFVQEPRVFGRGAAVANRLKRAAAFDCVSCTEYTVIGVTGRSGSGKGFVSAELSKALDLRHFDADVVYKSMLSSDGEMKRRVCEAFPDCVADGGIDRRALGRIVFADPSKKRLLESLTHPFVKLAAEEFVKKNRGAVIDAPLLFESTIDRLCTITVGVYCDDETSLRRILSRDGITEEAARLRLSAQPGTDFYGRRCDVMLDNRTSADLAPVIAKLIKK